MSRSIMSTLLKKRYCVLSFLFFLSILECDKLGAGVNAAEFDSLLGEDAKHSEENFVSRERKSVDEDGTKAGSREAHNISSPLPVNSRIAPSPSSVPTALTTRAIGSADGNRNFSTPSASVGPTKPSPNVTSTPESAETTEQATSAAATPTPTIKVSTEQSSLTTADTENVIIPTDALVRTRTTTTTIDETTEGGDNGAGTVRGREDPQPDKRKTLFGFVTVEILIALLAGAACAIILVAFLVYRIKKRSEGSYELCETVNYSKKTYSGKDSEKEVFV